MVTTFSTVSFVAAWDAYGQLAIVNTHAYDLSIFQQSLASTTQGFRVPFYESSDCIARSRCSLLLVHPAGVLYALVPFYALGPSALTLFAIRSIVVGAAAVPLYALTQRVTDSRAKGLLAAGLYLVWAPTLSGDLLSFHVESFLPLELFSLMALWQAGRYRWGTLAAVAAFLTIEVAPLFTLLIAVFFLVPFARPILRFARDRARTEWNVNQKVLTGLAALGRASRTALRQSIVRASVALALLSVTAFVAATLFANRFGSGLLGLGAPSFAGGSSGLFADTSSGPLFSSPLALLSSSAFVWTLEFWVILYALLGFLPLLSRRSLVLSVPWIAITFLSSTHRFSVIGTEYTMVALVPLFLGLAYGLARVPFALRVEPNATPLGLPPPSQETRRLLSSDRETPRRRRTPTWVFVLLAGLVAANLLLNPLVPLVPSSGSTMPGPFANGYFDRFTASEPGLVWVQEMVGEIPVGATVAVQNNLFPLVANDLGAYVLQRLNASQTNRLPFNLSAGPAYVLATPSTLTQGGTVLTDALQNASAYGLRAYVQETPIGPVVLFEQGYFGVARLFGPDPSSPGTIVAGAGLSAASRGVLWMNGTSGPPAINSTGKGEICTAPLGIVSSGTYNLTIRYELGQLSKGTTPNASALQLKVTGFQGLHWNWSINTTNQPTGTWTTATFPVIFTTASVNEQIQVWSRSVRITVAVAWVSWAPAP
jgi:uncharacterized membrane protein